MNAADFPGEGNPQNSPESGAGFPDEINRAPNTVYRKTIDDAISSLGGPIHKTIVWHMNNRGIFGDAEKVDTSLFYQNLKELLGQGADMIMENLSSCSYLIHLCHLASIIGLDRIPFEHLVIPPQLDTFSL